MGFTVQQVRQSSWFLQHRLEPYGVQIGQNLWHDDLKGLNVLTVEQVISLAVDAGLQPPDRDDLNIPQTVNRWMAALDICSIHELERATSSLRKEDRLEILGHWFNVNASGALPRRKERGKVFRYNLGHPSLLNNFLTWLISYLALHDDVDGRIGKEQEQFINCARQLYGKEPVRRY